MTEIEQLLLDSMKKMSEQFQQALKAQSDEFEKRVSLIMKELDILKAHLTQDVTNLKVVSSLQSKLLDELVKHENSGEKLKKELSELNEGQASSQRQLDSIINSLEIPKDE